MVKITGDVVTINGAKVTAADNAATNGVVHIIDTVLMPPSGDDDGDDNDGDDDAQNIVELAVATQGLATLVTAVKAADLVDALSGTDKLTVFAPDNAAFLKLPSAELTRLLLPENKAELAGILTYHVVAGAANAADLVDGQMLTTLQGESLTVNITGDSVFINGAKVTTADIA